MHIGIWELLVVGLILLLLFGKGQVSAIMGDLAKGITSFKKGLSGEAKPAEPAPPATPAPPVAAIAPPSSRPNP
jgi:sec-independent protein translocase protein TatA